LESRRGFFDDDDIPLEDFSSGDGIIILTISKFSHSSYLLHYSYLIKDLQNTQHLLVVLRVLELRRRRKKRKVLCQVWLNYKN
jgi:hypothetical protein